MRTVTSSVSCIFEKGNRAVELAKIDAKLAAC